MKPRITQWIILGLLILMIFHPLFNFKKKISPYGILLIDESESMRCTKKIEVVETDYTIKKFSFGAKESGTDLAKALLEAAETNPDVSFIILYSDGSNTKGKNPIKTADEIEIPVYFILPEFTEKIAGGFISVYGPNSIEEGDSAKITVYYKIPNAATLEINVEEKINKKNIKREGILDFSFLPSAGKKNIRLNLLTNNDTIDRTNLSFDVRKKRTLLIISEPPNWNYKFIKRYFEDKNWDVKTNKKDNINSPPSQNFDIICFLNNPVKHKEFTKNYLEEGGKIIVISSVVSNLDFLPVIAPTLTKYQGKLPVSYYLKPGGIRRNSKPLSANGENLGYIMRFDKGNIIQFTYLELWKLALSAGKLYPQNIFEILLDKSLKELITEETSIYYSNKLLEGEDFIIKFEKNEKAVKEFHWDGQKLPFRGDSIIINQPRSGLHYFKINLKSQSIEDSVLVINEPKDRMGLDTFMLKGIAAISGGGEWKKDFNKENFEAKEKEIWVNLRHNWFFIISLFLLIFFDWFLWMRKKS